MHRINITCPGESSSYFCKRRLIKNHNVSVFIYLTQLFSAVCNFDKTGSNDLT